MLSITESGHCGKASVSRCLTVVKCIINLSSSLSVDEETNGPWESNCNKIDYYQEASECTYSKALEEFADNIAQVGHLNSDTLEYLAMLEADWSHLFASYLFVSHLFVSHLL